MKKFTTILGIFLGALLFVPLLVIAMGPDDCKPGYEWKPSSGVGCVQIDCNDVPDAHWSYTQSCVCGSSGSIYEDASDPNKECNRSNDYTSCPGCVYACVHAGEACPDEKPATTTNSQSVSNSNTSNNINTNTSSNSNNAGNQNTNSAARAATSPSLSTTGNMGQACEAFCNKYVAKHKNAELTSYEGTPPDCKCTVDIFDDKNRLTDTLNVDGKDETTYTFNPSSGELIRRTTFNRDEEKERIRIRLGYRYTEDQIDAMLSDEKITKWFNSQMDRIDTSTSIKDPQFWWQHMVAIWDHGFSGNSADFVDTYRFGRCGDSMQWLERDFLEKMEIGKDPNNPGHKHEAILSITGEKYKNFVNHTAILVRPVGISNLEWDELVQVLKTKSGGAEGSSGIPNADLKDIDPRLLDAKVLDPYFQKQTTVRDFIKGWSYIRIS